jgi:hypothetical protein
MYIPHDGLFKYHSHPEVLDAWMKPCYEISTKTWLRNGIPHREDGPAHIDDYGYEYWIYSDNTVAEFHPNDSGFRTSAHINLFVDEYDDEHQSKITAMWRLAMAQHPGVAVMVPPSDRLAHPAARVRMGNDFRRKYGL